MGRAPGEARSSESALAQLVSESASQLVIGPPDHLPFRAAPWHPERAVLLDRPPPRDLPSEAASPALSPSADTPVDTDRSRDRAERRRSLKEDAVNLPNLLTMGRIVMIPVFLYYLEQNTPRDGVYASLVFTAAPNASSVESPSLL